MKNNFVMYYSHTIDRVGFGRGVKFSKQTLSTKFDKFIFFNNQDIRVRTDTQGSTDS